MLAGHVTVVANKREESNSTETKSNYSLLNILFFFNTHEFLAPHITHKKKKIISSELENNETSKKNKHSKTEAHIHLLNPVTPTIATSSGGI